jgi:hypothetical protein
MTNTKNHIDVKQTADIANQIADMLRDIKFGSIEIIVHESRVVQIERREKLRFDTKATLPK